MSAEVRTPSWSWEETRPLVLDLSEPRRPPRRRSDTAAWSTSGVVPVVAFWGLLAVTVELWWLDTPPGSFATLAGSLLAAGRLAGLGGGYALLAEILTMSRIPLLENGIGARGLATWHRWLGTGITILVPAHVLLAICGHAVLSQVSAARETWTMLRMYQDMTSAFIAIGILVGLVALSARAVRRALPYEAWHALHLGTYLVLLLAYGHQFAGDADLARPGFTHWYWLAMYSAVVACLAWGRVVAPLVLNARHRFRVLGVVREGPGTVSVHIGGRRLDALGAKSGQYLRWRFLTRGGWWQAHPFSLSASPGGDRLRFTAKVVGDHTRTLRRLRPGTRVVVEGPFGSFTTDHRRRAGSLLIAGGIGIAPIRALLEDLTSGTDLLYRASSEADLVLRAELDALARSRGARIHYVLGDRDAAGPRWALSPAGLRDLVPDIRLRDVYLCGPPGLMETAHRSLRQLRVPRGQIHLDPFEF
jgi:predicted ferric reductase